MNINSVSVIGLGYIGLPTAAILASHKFKTYGIDTNSKVVDVINEGKTHITEPGLKKIVQNSVESGFLHAYTEPLESDVFVITVPTPLRNDKSPRKIIFRLFEIAFTESTIKSS